MMSTLTSNPESKVRDNIAITESEVWITVHTVVPVTGTTLQPTPPRHHQYATISFSIKIDLTTKMSCCLPLTLIPRISSEK